MSMGWRFATLIIINFVERLSDMLLPDWAVLNAAIDWLGHGLWDLSWWQIVLFTLAMTHVTIASVTIFLHRHQAHRALDLHAIPSHFFRFWLWLTRAR